MKSDVFSIGYRDTSRLLENLRLLPGRLIIRRNGAGCTWGACVAGDWVGQTVGYNDRPVWTFQKGKSQYVVCLTSQCERMPAEHRHYLRKLAKEKVAKPRSYKGPDTRKIGIRYGR